MKLPRQPFVGLSIAAAVGIVLADYFPPSYSALSAITFTILIAAAALLRWPNERSTYAFVAGGFFVLHSIQTSATPGLHLAARIGEQPRALTVTGNVITESKIAPNGFATFLLKLASVDIDGSHEPTTRPFSCAGAAASISVTR